MREASSARPPHVVILGDYLPFPMGMAITNRARLVAQALRDSGVRVRVLGLQAADHPSRIENTLVRGEFHGILFEYACGRTVRHESFVARRLIGARGWLYGAWRLAQLRRQDRMDLVYLWFWTPRPAARLALFTALLWLLNVPVVREIDESTWSMKTHPTLLERVWSPLAGMDGAVTISAELRNWAVRESKGRRARHVVTVPILVDVDERPPTDYPTGEPRVVFAGSPVYRSTIRFVLAAMREVWSRRRDCRLVVAGAARGDPAADWLWEDLERAELDGRVHLAGYLRRPELLSLYESAHALLIPLFDDRQSTSRFPSKIGEYLAAARPVVTTRVGEIPQFLTDGVDAVLCPPGDPAAYGRAIVDLLDNPDRAALIGLQGRRIAETRLHFALYGNTLAHVFDEIIADRQTS